MGDAVVRVQCADCSFWVLGMANQLVSWENHSHMKFQSQNISEVRREGAQIQKTVAITAVVACGSSPL